MDRVVILIYSLLLLRREVGIFKAAVGVSIHLLVELIKEVVVWIFISILQPLINDLVIFLLGKIYLNFILGVFLLL